MFQGTMMRYLPLPHLKQHQYFLTASRSCFLTFYINTAFLHVSKYSQKKPPQLVKKNTHTQAPTEAARS
jgi:hypothetical protein